MIDVDTATCYVSLSVLNAYWMRNWALSLEKQIKRNDVEKNMSCTPGTSGLCIFTFAVLIEDSNIKSSAWRFKHFALLLLLLEKQINRNEVEKNVSCIPGISVLCIFTFAVLIQDSNIESSGWRFNHLWLHGLLILLCLRNSRLPWRCIDSRFKDWIKWLKIQSLSRDRSTSVQDVKLLV